ncbi:hypothetical protein KR009_011606 [Drosophila setifemur]|nr:hypothetical protein KR009_011606 [Drosophila setifemur]
MPVRLPSAHSLNIKWIDCPPLHPPHALQPLPPPPPTSPPKTNRKPLPLRFPLSYSVLLLLVLLLGEPAPGVCKMDNCSIIEGHVLQYVCRGTYTKEFRLQHKDRIAAIGAPYAIWKRTDSNFPSYLLISFYESPLFSCYTVVLSRGRFYCDGRNYEEPKTEPMQLHCINYAFHYNTQLYDECSKTPRPEDSQPVAVAIAYMKENIKVISEARCRLAWSAPILILVSSLALLPSRLFGILLSQ